jgi:hypothetical protein
LSIIHYENWDGVTPPSIPAGWNAPAQIITTTSGATPISSPNMITLSSPGSGTLYAITYGTPDTLSGNVAVVGTGQFSLGAASFSVLGRGSSSTLTYAGSTFYEARLDYVNSQVALYKSIAGVQTPIAFVGSASNPIAFTTATWYQIALTCNGTAIAVSVQRLSDGLWLNSGLGFQSIPTTAISITDGSITGSGYAGWGASAQTGIDHVYGDDWTFSSPAVQTGPLGWNINRRSRRVGRWSQAFPGGLTPTPTGLGGPVVIRPTSSPRRLRPGRALLGRLIGPALQPLLPRGGLSVSSPRKPRPGGLWQPPLLAPTPAAGPTPGLPPDLSVRSPRAARRGSVLYPRYLVGAPAPFALPPGLRVRSPRSGRAGSVLVLRYPSPGTAAAAALFMLPPRQLVRAIFRARSGRVWLPRPAGPAAAAVPTSPPLRPMSVSRPRPGRRGWVQAPRLLVAPPLPPGPIGLLRSGPLLVERRADRRARLRSGWLLHFIPTSQPISLVVQYHIYSNSGAGLPINYATPIATVSGTTWTSGPLAFPADWWFAVRAFNSFGEEQNLDAAVELILNAAGDDITNQPLPPLGLRAFAMAAGAVRVEWGFANVQPARVPTGFHVYIGTGGVPSYITPAATVSYASAIANTFVANLTGLSGGTVYTIGVRAFNASAEETNTTTVNVTADTTGPAPVDSLTATAIT